MLFTKLYARCCEKLLDSTRVRERLFLYMRMIFIYEPVRDHYLGLENSAAAAAAAAAAAEPAAGIEPTLMESPLEQGGATGSTHSLDCNKKACETKAGAQSSCSFMPESSRIYHHYYVASTLIHAYGAIQAALLILIRWSSLSIDLSWNCYIPGRLVSHESVIYMTPHFHCISSVLHLIWRATMMHWHQSFRSDCVAFLATPASDLHEHADSEFDLIVRDDDRASMAGWLKQVLYIEIDQAISGLRVRLLRPNRTLKAHQELATFFDKFVLFFVLGFATLALFVIPQALNCIIFDKYFIQNYPTCMPGLESLAGRGQLSSWSVAGLLERPSYRWLALPVDLIINGTVWIEDWILFFIPTTVSIVYSEDLVIYWRHLSSRLDNLLERMQSEPHKFAPTIRANLWGSRGSFSPVNLVDQGGGGGGRGWLERPDGRAASRRKLRNQPTSGLDFEIFALQRQVVDFFKQLRLYDKYVSILVAIVFLGWFAMFMMSSWAITRINSFTTVVTVRLFQIYGYLIISAPIYALIRIRTLTKRSYLTMASIMSHEKVPLRKEYWSQILEYYTYKQLFGFTILSTYPLTWMSYLNLVATSISFLVVVDTFWHFEHERITTT